MTLNIQKSPSLQARDRYLKEMNKQDIPDELSKAMQMIKNWNLRVDSLNTMPHYAY